MPPEGQQARTAGFATPRRDGPPDTSADLVLPTVNAAAMNANLALPTLPPYSPNLNQVENVRAYPRAK